MFIGAGTVLGGALWGLDASDGVEPIWWIIGGIVVALAGWIAWAYAISTRPSTAPMPTPPPAPSSSDASATTPDLDRLRGELRAYGLTAFAAVSLFLIALSQERGETSLRYLPDALAIDFSDFVYGGLAGLFFVVAIALLAGASLPPLTRWFERRRWSFEWMEVLAGLFTWVGVTVGWLGSLSLALAVPTPLAYAYFYGGFIVFLLVGLLFVSGGIGFTRRSTHSDPPEGPAPLDAETSETPSE